MIYSKECRCFAKTNTAFFFPSPPLPETIASHEHLSLQPLGFLSAVILQVSCHRIASGFLMPTSGFARYVHTLQRHGRHSQDTIPKKPHPEKLLSHALLDGQAWGHLHTLHNICRVCPAFAQGLAQPVHGAGMACMAFAHSACSHRALHTPPPTAGSDSQEPNTAGAGGRGRAGRGRLH